MGNETMERALVLARRFLKRAEVADLGLTEEEVAKVLIQHAKKWGGCINCMYSTPSRGRFSWLRRGCVLGLSQGTCGMQKPIVD